jgi:hypothetical protein
LRDRRGYPIIGFGPDHLEHLGSREGKWVNVRRYWRKHGCQACPASRLRRQGGERHIQRVDEPGLQIVQLNPVLQLLTCGPVFP